MRRRLGAALTLLVWVGASACGGARPEGDAIVVALANSPVNFDPRVGADEASQKAHQLLYSTRGRIEIGRAHG